MARTARLLLVPLLLAAACAHRAHFVATATDHQLPLAAVAADLARADVVVLGELHDQAAVHAAHQELVTALHSRRPDLVLAFEMFERDVQTALLQYVNGLSSEREFLGRSRPWSNYATDYRPLVEFARAERLSVLAANAPRPLCAKVAQTGLAAVAGDPHVAREVHAPEDADYAAFAAMMQGHLGTGTPERLRRMYEAQCLKDDTMAETLVDYLRSARAAGRRPLVVLVVGKGHSDARRGVVQRIARREPELAVRVLSCEVVADLDETRYRAPRDVADYVVVVERSSAPSAPPAVSSLAPTEPAVASVRVVAESAAAAPAPADAAPNDARPALGLMPDYGAEGAGVRVQAVRPGGPAERAGLQDGDVVVAIAGREVADVGEYTALLDSLQIGSEVAVRVRRGASEHEFKVRIGARSR